MPAWIDHCPPQLFVLSLYHFYLSITMDRCSTMFASDMEHILVRISLVSYMTVNTHTAHLDIRDKCLLIEVTQITLIESHLAVDFETGSNTPISNPPLLERLFTDCNCEVTELCPLSLFLSTYSKGKLCPTILHKQCVPLLYIKVCIVTIHMQRSTFSTSYQYIHRCYSVISHREIQGCNTNWYCHIHIVWIDNRQLIHMLRMLWLSATSQQQQRAHEGYYQTINFFSHCLVQLIE